MAAELGDTPGFFQLYTPNDRELAESLVHRAEAAGYTGDRRHARHLGHRLAAARPGDRATSRSCAGHCLANYFSDPVFRAPARQRRRRRTRRPPSLHWAQMFGNPLTWDDLAWLRSLTDLPLLAQGHLPPRRRPPGHRRAASTASTAPTTAAGRPTAACPRSTACPTSSTRPAALPVLFDSGVRRGADVVKALALGATAVGIGRPYAYGCALGGTDGIVHVLR